MEIIRKISVGSDWENAIHYQVGGRSKISNIIEEEGRYNVYIKEEGVNIKWKSFNKDVVSHVEFDTKKALQ